MKKIKLYIAASLDGYIACPDGDIEWLTGFPNPSNSDYGYKDFLTTVDTVIMGGRTYRDILCMDVIWPYKGMDTYVISHHTWENKEDIRFITENIVETVAGLREKEGKDIWLIGGGEIISMLLDADLVDELQIFYMPVMLGDGIRLFPPNKQKEAQWDLIESKSYDNGVLEAKYQRK
jgi:dihydrofolate reductase